MWWIRSDLCGMFSAGFTVVLLLFAQYVIVTVVILPWYGFSMHVALYTALSMLALISHCRAQFSDPGAVPWDRIPPPPTVIGVQPDGQQILSAPPRVCRRCKTLKPWKAHHCSTCGRCMIRMDHHCPWVNNCVAIANQKYFLLFLLYTCLCCIYCGALLVGRFISCTHNLKSCSIGGLHAVLCVLNFIEAVIFGLFCLIMLWDQLTAIFENTPGIDALQNRHGARRGWYASLVEVFGERVCWRWWLPLDMPPQIAADFEAEMAQMDDPDADPEYEQAQQAAFEQLQRNRQKEVQRQLVIPGARTLADTAAAGKGKQTATAGSAAAASAGAPVVFPDGYEPLSRDADDDLDPVLAALQSPPHSPSMQGLSARHAAVKTA